MSDTNHSPVSLPAGSFDYDTLKSGLGAASRGSAADYDAAVKSAIEKAGVLVHAGQDARDIPNYKFVDVEVPELGVIESRQVFVPPADVDAASPPPPPPSSPIVDKPTDDPIVEPVPTADATDTGQPEEAALVTTQTRRKASAAATTTEKE